MASDNRSLIELPRVNLEGVLTKLPLPSLFACCCVSKSLLNLIKNDSDFAKMHLSKSKPQLMIQPRLDLSIHLLDLDTDTTTASRVEVKPSFNNPLDGFGVAHSCNGLLLLETLNMVNGVHRLLLCNPVTGEYTLLPDSVTLYKSGITVFFYCPKTHNFEVVSAFHCLSPVLDDSSDSFMDLDPDSGSDSDSVMELNLVSDHDTNSEGSDQEPYSDSDADSDSVSMSDAMGEIYVKGSDSWESLGNLPFSPLTIYSPCHLDKVTHWICADEAVPNVIVFFSFETHEFGEIPGPTHLGKAHAHAYNGLNLLVLGDCLSVFERFTSKTKIYVWVMKEYGVRDSWSRDYVIDNTVWGVYDPERYLTPVICRNNGEIVMVSVYGYILFYDLLTKKGRVVIHPPLKDPWRAVMHTPSLLSLRDVVRGSNLEVVNVTSRLADPRLNPHNYLKLAATFSEAKGATWTVLS